MDDIDEDHLEHLGCNGFVATRHGIEESCENAEQPDDAVGIFRLRYAEAEADYGAWIARTDAEMATS